MELNLGNSSKFCMFRMEGVGRGGGRGNAVHDKHGFILI